MINGLDKIRPIVVNKKERNDQKKMTTLRDVSDFCFLNGAFISRLVKKCNHGGFKGL